MRIGRTRRSQAKRRGALLDWLKAESPANTCRILSNARCLSEGVDVPALDAVLFRTEARRLKFQVKNGMSLTARGHIDVYEPGRRLRLIYLPSSELPPSDTAIIDDFILDATPPATIVRLLGSGIPSSPDWDAQYRRLRMGWQAAMTRLKVFVERQMVAGAPTGT